VQEQLNASVGLGKPEAARPPGWKAAAIGEYERSWPTRQADLRTDLSARILALTRRHIFPEEIYTDGHLAVADVDGITLRLHRRSLALVRTCAYCGTGRFESPKISNLADLGYALSAWKPLHEDCEVFSPEELPDF
jgi:hypothetical protein